MTPEAEAIKEIFMQIKPELMWTLFQTSIIAIAILMFHKVLKSVAAYLSFRANKDIGKNVKIMIKNREAMITHFTIRFIFLRFKDNGNEMIVPMGKWENLDWELIKNGIK
jgi:hypothetical protein